MSENLDGRVNIGTSIDGSGAEKGMRQLQRELVASTQKIAKSLEEMEHGTEQTTSRMGSMFSGMTGKTGTPPPLRPSLRCRGCPTRATACLTPAH